MRKIINVLGSQTGVIHTLPLLLIVAAVGIISFLLVSSTAPFKGGLFNQTNPKTPSEAAISNCGLANAIFCDTFDGPKGIGNRSGDLDGNVWGVSRTIGGLNFGQSQYDAAPPTSLVGCNGNITVRPPNDIVICNGQLREATNDNPSNVYDAGSVTALAMYPKQPFDFANRTGTVAFDVSNDTHGSHAAWPEFWLSDLPVPVPFNHFASWLALPQNGFGIRFAAAAAAGTFGICPTVANTNRWSVDSAIVIRNYIWDDYHADYGQSPNLGTPSSMTVKVLDCVTRPADNSGVMNHVEIRVAQNQIDVYASDAGTTAPLKHIAIISNANLTLSRGLIWLEDVHYNADKAESGPNVPSQRQHTFMWDNVAFDGPFTYRDFSYDALDANQPGPADNTWNLGKFSGANQTASWNVLNMPANPQAAAARVLFNFSEETYPVPTTLNVIVNGHSHSVAWPYPDSATNTWRTFAVTIPLSDLVTGTNVVQIGSNQPLATANVNIVLVDVPGGVPVLPGSINTYPGLIGTPISTPTPAPVSSPTPAPAITPTPAPVNGAWANVTTNLANLASECGNLTMLSNVPGSNMIIAGIAQRGLWSNLINGAGWSNLGTGVNSAVITNRPSWISYDPLNSSTFYESGIYNGGGVYKTTNGGTTFTQLGNIGHIDYVSVDYSDLNRQTLLAGGHEQSQKVYKSTNGGQTWTEIGINLPAGTGFSTNPVIINSQTYLVNTDTSWSGGTPGIYRTTNGGATWVKVSSQGPSGAPLITSNGTIYWAWNGSLLKSSDSGVTWSQVGSNLSGIHPIQLPDGRLVTVSGNTLVTSSDAGSTWSPLGPALPFGPASLIYSPNRQAFFASHWDCGAVVLSNAVAKLDYSIGSGSTNPTPSPTPKPTVTPFPTPTPTVLPTPFPTVVPTAVPTPVSTPAPGFIVPAAASISTSAVSCIPSAGYTGSGINITWQNPVGGNPVSWVDVGTDSGFNTFYNKKVLGLTSTSLPSGFNLYLGTGSPALTILPNVTYSVRLYNDTLGMHSASSTFNIPVCPQPTPTPRPTATSTPTTVSVITISAGGQSGIFNNQTIKPTMSLIINGVTKQTWTNVGGNGADNQFLTFSYSSPTKVTHDNVRISFTNDAWNPATGQDVNLFVKQIVIDGVTYPSNAPSILSTGVYTPASGCAPGNKQSIELSCTGYFQY